MKTMPLGGGDLERLLATHDGGDFSLLPVRVHQGKPQRLEILALEPDTVDAGRLDDAPPVAYLVWPSDEAPPGPFGARWVTPVPRETASRADLARRMQQLLADTRGVVHDLNNQLTLILGACELASESPNADPGLRADLLDVLRAAGRAADQLRGFQTRVHAEAARVDRVDLESALRAMGGVLRHALGEDVRVVILPPARPAEVELVPGALDVVLAELESGAAALLPRRGLLTLRGQAAAGPDSRCPGCERATGPTAHTEPPSCVRVTLSFDAYLPKLEALVRLFEPLLPSVGLCARRERGAPSSKPLRCASRGRITLVEATRDGAAFSLCLPRATPP